MPAEQKIPVAQINVGTLFPTSQDALFLGPNNASPGIFNDYMVLSHYEGDKHRYMMGVTSPNGFQGNSVAFVQLASPTLLWIADWTASKVGSQPEMPSTTPADPNWVFLDEQHEPAMITLMADGRSVLYRISGIYIYGHKNPSENVITHVNFGRPPWMQDTTDRQVSLGKMQGSIIDYKGGPAARGSSTGVGSNEVDGGESPGSIPYPSPGVP